MKSRIGEWIDERGYSNKHIAKQLKVTVEMVYRWRNDKSFPRLDKAFKLASLLSVKVDDLYHTDTSEKEDF